MAVSSYKLLFVNFVEKPLHITFKRLRPDAFLMPNQQCQSTDARRKY